MLTIRTLVATLAVAAAATAQTQLAVLSGQVTDSTGGAVPNVQLRLVSMASGETYQAVAGATGHYVIPLVKPGVYKLSAEAPGFKQYHRTGIVLETGAQAAADVQLQVGDIAESVTVTADVALLKTETSSVGAVIDNQTIRNMPLINRRALQLIKLSGFVVPVGNEQGRASIGGGRGAENMWVVDGGLIQNVTVDTPEPFFDPPIESLQEFNVAVSNFSAELGRTGGGVVQVTTKSGTNHFHGSAYEYFRNDKLDARTFFAASKEELRYNLFGASLGGPIRRDRTFFFFNYEGLRSPNEVTRIQNVPTLAEARGDFSQQSTVVRDPESNNTPFPRNVIPASRLDPVGAAIAALFPEPNVPGRPTRSNNFRMGQSINLPSNDYVARVDHTFSERDRIFGRALIRSFNRNEGPIFPTPGVDSFHRGGGSQPYYNLSSTWIRNLTPTWLNEARFTFVNRVGRQWHGSYGLGLPAKIGLKGTNPELFPRVNVAGLAAMGNPNRQLRRQDPIRNLDFVENVTKISGNHTIKFGTEYRMDRNDDYFSGFGGGVFNFNNTATGDALAALLLGWVLSANRQEVPLIRSRADYLSLFLQDDWKVHPRLTLNLGLRYDLEQPRWEAIDNRQNSFDRASINPVCNCPGTVTFSGRNGKNKYAHNWDPNNFGPRLGFAYRAAERWVVRGGGAVIYMAQYNNNVAFDPSLGFGILGSFVSPNNGLTPAFRLRDGLPPIKEATDADRTPGFGAAAPGANPFTSVLFLEPEGRSTGYSVTYNFNIQRQLTPNLLLEIGYLGSTSHSVPSPANRTINQVPPELMGAGNTQSRRPFPQFSDVSVLIPTIGNAGYNGLNVKVDKRYSAGLHFQANYTWSRSLDDVEARAELGSSPGSGFADYYNRRADRGLSGNHVLHRAVWSSVYELPVGQGRLIRPGNAVLNAIIGAWSLGYIAELRSGPPYGVVENVNRTNAFSDQQRPDVAGDPSLPGGRPRAAKVSQWFNTAAFSQPAQFTFGNASRTSGYAPGAVIMDLSVLKDFPFREQHRLQVRLEMLNFLNRPNFGLPATSRGAANFGQISSLAPGNQARIVQLGLHYRF